MLGMEGGEGGVCVCVWGGAGSPDLKLNLFFIPGQIEIFVTNFKTNSLFIRT